MKDPNCIFCKLANGEIPTNKIFEDEDFTVILDASPATKGHALILPKEHFKNLYELDDEVGQRIIPLAKKAAAHMTETLHCDGFNLVQNNNEVAGQTVFHFHMHLIPRYEDGQRMLEWPHESFSEEEMKELATKLSF